MGDGEKQIETVKQRGITEADLQAEEKLCPVDIRLEALQNTNVIHVQPAAHKKEWLKESPEKQEWLANKALCRLPGAVNHNVGIDIIQRTSAALPDHKNVEKQLTLVIASLSEMQPRDAIEGMLCSQAIALYTQGMENLQRAEHSKNMNQVNLYYTWAFKLLRLHQETIEKLDKYRRKGQQSVRVEHVHVHNGGQAIVGNVTTGGDNVRRV